MPAPEHSRHSRLPSTTAHELIRQTLARETGGGASAAAMDAAAERIFVQMTAGLTRWFGPVGAHSLSTRALAHVLPHHPVLAGVRTTESAGLTGLAEAARAHGPQATTEGIVALTAALADLVGRLIGDDLAINLLEQSMRASSASDRAAPDATAMTEASDDESP